MVCGYVSQTVTSQSYCRLNIFSNCAALNKLLQFFQLTPNIDPKIHFFSIFLSDNTILHYYKLKNISEKTKLYLCIGQKFIL